VPFADYIGNASVVESLRRLGAEDRLPQTLLFAGPLGVGKSTCARFLAAALNCDREDGDFCGECSNCRRILAADLSLPEYVDQVAERAKLRRPSGATRPWYSRRIPMSLSSPRTARCA